MQSSFGAVRHQRGESYRRWLITVMLFIMFIARKGDTTTLGPKGRQT